MDDLLLALLICVTLIVIAYMATRVLNEYFRAKAAKSRQMSAVRRGTPSKAQEIREPAPWVGELLEGLGHSEEELYEDEMPDDLVTLLNSPLVKGFLGGLGKGGQGGQGAPQNQESFY